MKSNKSKIYFREIAFLEVFSVQKLIFCHFWNCKNWNLVKKITREIDLLFDFTSFLAWTFLNFPARCVIFWNLYISIVFILFSRNFLFYLGWGWWRDSLRSHSWRTDGLLGEFRTMSMLCKVLSRLDNHPVLCNAFGLICTFLAKTNTTLNLICRMPVKK